MLKRCVRPWTSSDAQCDRVDTERTSCGSRLEGAIGEAMACGESAALGDLLCGLDAEGDVVEFAGETWRPLGVSTATYSTQSGPTTIERRLFRQSSVHNGPTFDVVAARAGLVGD